MFGWDNPCASLRSRMQALTTRSYHGLAYRYVTDGGRTISGTNLMTKGETRNARGTHKMAAAKSEPKHGVNHSPQGGFGPIQHILATINFVALTSFKHGPVNNLHSGRRFPVYHPRGSKLGPSGRVLPFDTPYRLTMSHNVFLQNEPNRRPCPCTSCYRFRG